MLQITLAITFSNKTARWSRFSWSKSSQSVFSLRLNQLGSYDFLIRDRFDENCPKLPISRTINFIGKNLDTHIITQHPRVKRKHSNYGYKIDFNPLIHFFGLAHCVFWPRFRANLTLKPSWNHGRAEKNQLTMHFEGRQTSIISKQWIIVVLLLTGQFSVALCSMIIPGDFLPK